MRHKNKIYFILGVSGFIFVSLDLLPENGCVQAMIDSSEIRFTDYDRLKTKRFENTVKIRMKDDDKNFNESHDVIFPNFSNDPLKFDDWLNKDKPQSNPETEDSSGLKKEGNNLARFNEFKLIIDDHQLNYTGNIKEIAEEPSLPIWHFQGETVSITVSVANQSDPEEFSVEFDDTSSLAGEETSTTLPVKEQSDSIFNLDSLFNLWLTVIF